jgi:acetyltransferase
MRFLDTRTDYMPHNSSLHAFHLNSGQPVMIRPARPHDAEMIQAYVRGLSPASRYFRFLGAVSELSEAELHRATHAEEPRAMTLVAEAVVDGARTMIGEARWQIADDGASCEVALSVADGLRRRKLGTRLIDYIAHRVAKLGAHNLVCDILHSNDAARSLACKLGFCAPGLATDARCIRLAKDLRAGSSIM